MIGATNHLSFTGLLLTLAFATGAGVPLLAVALAGDAVIDRVRALRDRARGMRIGGGAVLLLMTLAIGLNLTDGLQQDVPGYTSALQSSVEGGKSVQSQLQSLTRGGSASLVSCTRSATLQDCFAAPNFQGIAAWLNTAGGAPLTVKSLRGKVVLIDFWTYSCINCQRSLPHVEALVPALPRRRPGGRRGAHPGVRLRACRLQRAERGATVRHHLPGRRRQQLRHLERVRQRVLAG